MKFLYFSITAMSLNHSAPQALWTEYLRVKSLVISVSDLTGLYQQALRLAPSPLLWRNFAPKLNSLKERISALDSALQICGIYLFIDCMLMNSDFVRRFTKFPTAKTFNKKCLLCRYDDIGRQEILRRFVERQTPTYLSCWTRLHGGTI